MGHLEVLKYFLKLRKEQWYPPEKLQEIQDQRLEEILKHASNSEFYSFLNDGCEFSEIPITTKEEIKSHKEKFLTAQESSLKKFFTSGSTGRPMQVCIDKQASAYRAATLAFVQLEFGRRPLDLYAEITHKTPPPFPLAPLGIFRKLHISVFEDQEKMFHKLKKAKPDILGWYPSINRVIAKLNDAEGRPLKLKSVYSGAEVLTAQCRKLIEDSFSCPVFEQYSSIEFGNIAWECPEEHSLHVNNTSCLVEILGENGKPKKSGTGRVVITGLINRSMPLIRYSIEDLASWGRECPCGRGLPVLRHIQGREDDDFVLPSGKIRPARSIDLMDSLTEILQCQIVQEEDGTFIFRYIPVGKEISEATKKAAARVLENGCCGEKIKIEFQKVDKMERGRTGKLRKIISNALGRRNNEHYKRP